MRFLSRAKRKEERGGNADESSGEESHEERNDEIEEDKGSGGDGMEEDEFLKVKRVDHSLQEGSEPVVEELKLDVSMSVHEVSFTFLLMWRLVDNVNVCECYSGAGRKRSNSRSRLGKLEATGWCLMKMVGHFSPWRPWQRKPTRMEVRIETQY